MKKTTLKVFALLALLLAVSVISLSAPAAPDATLKELAGYRQWKSVKGEPGQLKILPDSISIEALSVAT